MSDTKILYNIQPINNSRDDLSREDCILDFWDSFINSVNLAGGIPTINGWKNKTLQELGETLAQNGIRFTHSKDKALK